MVFTPFSRSGRITRLSVRSGVTFIRLDIPAEDAPSSEFFELRMSTENYNALYSLVLAAAINRFPITIRTVNEISKSERGVVQYINMDWAEHPDD